MGKQEGSCVRCGRICAAGVTSTFLGLVGTLVDGMIAAGMGTAAFPPWGFAGKHRIPN